MEPTIEENHQHLKEELLRQLAIGDAVKVFNRIALKESINIYGELNYQSSIVTLFTTMTDLRMAKSFLLRVCEGEKLDRVWLVDALLDQQRMKKFSGTERAGENHDLAGKTCGEGRRYTRHVQVPGI